MTPSRFKYFLIPALLFVLCANLRAQVMSCVEVSALAKMARAKSFAALVAGKRKAGESYRAQIVFSARLLELNPAGKRAANALLKLIPKDEAQQLTLMTLGDSLCDTEQFRDMDSLDRIGERIPKDLATAVLQAPDKLIVYVSYAYQAAQDPHNDYAVQMVRVCRRNHAAFIKAVNQLGDGGGAESDFPTVSSAAFRKRIFDPDGCRPLIFPEAD